MIRHRHIASRHLRQRFPRTFDRKTYTSDGSRNQWRLAESVPARAGGPAPTAGPAPHPESCTIANASRAVTAIATSITRHVASTLPPGRSFCCRCTVSPLSLFGPQYLWHPWEFRAGATRCQGPVRSSYPHRRFGPWMIRNRTPSHGPRVEPAPCAVQKRCSTTCWACPRQRCSTARHHGSRSAARPPTAIDTAVPAAMSGACPRGTLPRMMTPKVTIRGAKCADGPREPPLNHRDGGCS